MFQCEFCVFVSKGNKVSSDDSSNNEEQGICHWIHEMNFPEKPYKKYFTVLDKHYLDKEKDKEIFKIQHLNILYPGHKA